MRKRELFLRLVLKRWEHGQQTELKVREGPLPGEKPNLLQTDNRQNIMQKYLADLATKQKAPCQRAEEAWKSLQCRADCDTDQSSLIPV